MRRFTGPLVNALLNLSNLRPPLTSPGISRRRRHTCSSRSCAGSRPRTAWRLCRTRSFCCSAVASMARGESSQAKLEQFPAPAILTVDLLHRIEIDRFVGPCRARRSEGMPQEGGALCRIRGIRPHCTTKSHVFGAIQELGECRDRTGKRLRSTCRN
jgi:hypothetical protein